MFARLSIYRVIPVLFLLISLVPGWATGAPLLEQVATMKAPGERGIFSLFDVITIVILTAFYFRIKGAPRKDLPPPPSSPGLSSRHRVLSRSRHSHSGNPAS